MKLVWLAVTAGIAGTAAVSLVVRRDVGLSSQAQVGAAPQPPQRVACLGRIQPEDGTVIIGARSLSGQASIVEHLRVKEGDEIKAGDVIALLNSGPQLEAAWRQAAARVKVAETRMHQVTVGAKAADIAAQQEEVTRLELELTNARTQHGRTELLFKERLVSQSAFDQSRLPVDTTTRAVAAAKARLRSLTEVRQIDVEVAQAELQEARADERRARAEADAAVVRSPYDGRVVKIHAWQGEEIDSNGILELARVNRMYVLAEVAESDVARVRIGQRATITGDSLTQSLEGSVEQVGFKVSRNSLVQRDPVNLTDARIVEVKILLDDGRPVKSLIGAQVEVVIRP